MPPRGPVSRYGRVVESGKVRSFVAEGYEPRFDKKQREAVRPRRGRRDLATFVVAKLDWNMEFERNIEFEIDVMRAILTAFNDDVSSELQRVPVGRSPSRTLGQVGMAPRRGRPGS